jgi:hypothetical protein
MWAAGFRLDSRLRKAAVVQWLGLHPPRAQIGLMCLLCCHWYQQCQGCYQVCVCTEQQLQEGPARLYEAIYAREGAVL